MHFPPPLHGRGKDAGSSFPPRHGGGGMIRLIDAPVPRRRMLREQVKRVNDERCHRHTQERPGADYCTLIHHGRIYNMIRSAARFVIMGENVPPLFCHLFPHAGNNSISPLACYLLATYSRKWILTHCGCNKRAGATSQWLRSVSGPLLRCIFSNASRVDRTESSTI